MTHSLTTVAEALRHPKRLYGVDELSGAPNLIPQEGGVYAWWFSKAPPGVPIDDTAVHDGRRLLYVGIAPRKPSAAGSVSSRNLRHRLLTHCRGGLSARIDVRFVGATLWTDMKWVCNGGRSRIRPVVGAPSFIDIDLRRVSQAARTQESRW
jgi:hypothetical protein